MFMLNLKLIKDVVDKITKNTSDIEQLKLSNVYSTEEVIIGKYFGKNLYRKTIDRGKSLSSFEHNIKNVESIFINNDHTYRVHTSGNCISLNASGAGSYVYVNKTTVTINNTSGASPDKVYVTLEYTKTSD